MEFPSFNHHHNRYVPPPPPDSFSDNNPNHFPHHHHFIPPVHLPPPPPLYPSLPMPPPPPLLPVPPPPPSYNPHQSHFTFLDAQNPSFPNHNHSSPPPPRFSNQFHQFDYRADSRSDPHRIAPELPNRNPILPDNHNRRMHSPNPQSESYYNHNGSERVIPSSRFRDDTISDAYASRDISNIVSQEKQGFRGSPNKDRNTDRYASGNSVTNIDKPTCSNSRKLGDYVENYEPHYKPTPENQRIWDHHGEEDPKWVMKSKKNGVPFVSDREQSRVREGGEEFKQVQKKSVLLRIGKPNNTNRNRNHDQHSSKTKLVESNNNKSKGKDKDRNRDHTGKDSSLHTDQKIEKEREHSPVDLDVSFKSNTLVAKPVLTPSSPISDTNNTKPRNDKNKKSNKFGPPLSKFSDRLTSPEKVPKQQKDKKTVNNSVNGSSSCPVLDNGVNNGGSGRLSFRLKKKRKLMNLDSVASNFQLAVKNNKSLKSEIVKSTPIVPISSDISFPPLKESNSSKDGSKVKNSSVGDDSTENKNLTSQKVSINGLVIDLNQQPVENENESLPILENEISATDVNLSVDGTDSLGQDQIEIQKCQTESKFRFDSCSDEIIVENSNVDIIDLTNVDNQTCLNGSIKIHEDGPKESLYPVIIADDNATTHKGNSFNKDEVSDMVISVSPENREPSPSTDETYLVQNDDLPPFPTHADETCAVVTNSNDKSVESMPDIVANIVSSQKISSKSADKTVSDSSTPKNKDNIYEKSESKDAALLNRQLEVTNTVSNTKVEGLNLPIKKRDPVPTVPKVFANRSTPVFTIPRINKPANNITKPRTWHRSTDNPVPQPPKKQIVTNQNSYIRTGNSLVRKLNPSGPTETRNSLPPVTKMNNTYSRTNAPVIVRPNTPPLSTNTKIPDCPSHTRSLPSSPLEHIPSSPVEEDLSVQKVSQDQNSENQKIHYVKRKSNQLVATSSSDQIHDLDKNQTSVSDGYYKRRKNQLIRSTSVDDDSANSDQHKASKINIKRQSGKGIYKKYKNLRFPSVWTLNSSQSLGKSQKLRAPLFPWKRSRNWGNMMNISASIPSNSSSSSISRKLLHSRNREMIYTRSKHGFSLKMSKLLSVGGSGLKWSKSIEKKSKRANEEATLAVAAAEKKKREENGSAEINRRERIYRIGLVRYKMDPSRRTLQRISGDEEPSTSVQKKEEIRKSYIPKRLKIGHDEYVRIGNGNQLVRNPKRRTRMFANEKVRWSLHTARSRLAKKKKYCQFFTRFGKCNKDDGKCPYIHDSSKIAVCTKFLNGSCSNPNCNLTHKVIPERMQDCSYFSQGLCSNENCPYRHVNVSSSASICEGFLKGFCADGNECRKKHTYACPIFEATGECPQGTKCKLHHPKNRKTGLKRKQQDKIQQNHKNSRGRYFGAFMGLETMSVSEKHHSKDDVDKDILCEDGKFGEYISLDCGNEEVASEERRMLVDETGVTDVDELTKPIRIMNRRIV